MKGSVMGTGAVAVLASEVSETGGGKPISSPDRRTVRNHRRKSRRVRRLYALAGIAVLVAFLVATVVVVDMVR
jgi:hypothetical protein